MRGDLADAAAVRRACDGRNLVFHVAAQTGLWGPHAEFRRTNVEGTRNVLAACRDSGVRRLVYTSTPSVVFDGRDLEGINESAPYPPHWKSAYPATKAEAEQLVLAADGPELATVALRPHLVWGPGDPHFVPRILSRARAGRLRIVGDGTNRVDAIYIDDAAEAHLRAAERLSPGARPSGRAYFLSRGEPTPLWDLVNRILAAAGEPPVTRRVPASLAYAAGAALESLHRFLRIESEPIMTRFLARELSASHWFDISAARRDLGFEPRMSLDEGMERLGAWCREEGLASP
jgi:nucleoside-diphosphate-sugar epimerase